MARVIRDEVPPLVPKRLRGFPFVVRSLPVGDLVSLGAIAKGGTGKAEGGVSGAPSPDTRVESGAG